MKWNTERTRNLIASLLGVIMFVAAGSQFANGGGLEQSEAGLRSSPAGGSTLSPVLSGDGSDHRWLQGSSAVLSGVRYVQDQGFMGVGDASRPYNSLQTHAPQSSLLAVAANSASPAQSRHIVLQCHPCLRPSR